MLLKHCSQSTICVAGFDIDGKNVLTDGKSLAVVRLIEYITHSDRISEAPIRLIPPPVS